MSVLKSSAQENRTFPGPFASPAPASHPHTRAWISTEAPGLQIRSRRRGEAAEGRRESDTERPESPAGGCSLSVSKRTMIQKDKSTPLSAVVEQLSVKLGVPPPRLLLLREEAELSRDSTVGALGLGIADILECVVMAESDRDTHDDHDVIKVRLQGKDRAMTQEFTLRRDAPLGSVFSQYSSGLPVVAQRKVSFISTALNCRRSKRRSSWTWRTATSSKSGPEHKPLKAEVSVRHGGAEMSVLKSSAPENRTFPGLSRPPAPARTATPGHGSALRPRAPETLQTPRRAAEGRRESDTERPESPAGVTPAPLSFRRPPQAQSCRRSALRTRRRFFSDDSESEAQDETRAEPRGEAEPASGVSKRRAVLTVFILCYINLLNYMDRFTVAVFICSYMFLAPVFGYLGDRYNRKYIMSTGIFFWSLVTLLSSYTPKDHFWALLLTRGLVGVGEASYSTIAPTIIADLYVKGQRTNMLSIFYFAIPVGSGLGYIVGSQVSQAAHDWHWALRVTPGLGLVAVVLLLFVVQEPKRGAVEARSEEQLHPTNWTKDLQALRKNRSFVLSTFGFTAVAFVTGSLALWAPTFLLRAAIFMGQKSPCETTQCSSSESLLFGAITCITGVLGVASGVQLSRALRNHTQRADPLVCASGLLLSAPFLYLAIVFAELSTTATYIFIFFGEMFLSMNWAIVADILLCGATRRSQLKLSDRRISPARNAEPYLIGVVSDSLRREQSFLWQFRSLQLSLASLFVRRRDRRRILSGHGSFHRRRPKTRRELRPFRR
ncbi:hypothetical protein WMY93_001608 [Mugilogobius chulae]|uniref:Protein spinster homolog 1 n=1 Tax=Mugilogobius chulae TaxID=88201 RepID=A0AAW0PUQ1_9GOBI